MNYISIFTGKWCEVEDVFWLLHQRCSYPKLRSQLNRLYKKYSCIHYHENGLNDRLTKLFERKWESYIQYARKRADWITKDNISIHLVNSFAGSNFLGRCANGLNCEWIELFFELVSNSCCGLGLNRAINEWRTRHQALTGRIAISFCTGEHSFCNHGNPSFSILISWFTIAVC